MMKSLMMAATVGVMAMSACGAAVTFDCASVGNATYTQDVKPVLDAHCIKCHSTEKTNFFARQRAPDGVDFNTYAAAKAHAKEGADEVESGSMPPAESRDTLTKEQACVLRGWIKNGLPE